MMRLLSRAVFRSKAFLLFVLNTRKSQHIPEPAIKNILSRAVEVSYNQEKFDSIENLRKALKKEKSVIHRTDFGAGTQGIIKRKDRVSSLAKSSLSTKAQCRFLYELAKEIKAHKILELGTSFGISTAYLAMAQDTQITTLEGDPQVAEIARSNFKKLSLYNIELITGQFESSINTIQKQKERFDLIYIDGDHTFEGTLQYFNQLLPLLTKNGVLLFDDIRWSGEMEKVWYKIVKHPKSRMSIDLFNMGLVVPGSNQAAVLKIWPGWKWMWSSIS